MKYVLLKIHNRQILNADNFPQLRDNDELIDEEDDTTKTSTTDVFFIRFTIAGRYGCRSETIRLLLASLNSAIQDLWGWSFRPAKLPFPGSMAHINSTLNALLIVRHGVDGQLIEFSADTLRAQPTRWHPHRHRHRHPLLRSQMRLCIITLLSCRG